MGNKEDFWQRLENRRYTSRRPGRPPTEKPDRDNKPKVYFVTDGEYIKIGFTSGPVKQRLADLQVGNARELTVIGWYYAPPIHEDRLHARFKYLHVRGEWFKNDLDIIYHAQHFDNESYDDELAESFDVVSMDTIEID